MSLEITLPLPPSVNTIYMWNPRTHQKIYKKEAREWLEENTEYVRYSLPLGHKPINEYVVVKLKFWLPRRNSDAHNYEKLLFDCLEHGGLVENDRVIMNQTISIEIDSKNPRVTIIVE